MDRGWPSDSLRRSQPSTHAWAVGVRCMKFLGRASEVCFECDEHSTRDPGSHHAIQAAQREGSGKVVSGVGGLKTL